MYRQVLDVTGSVNPNLILRTLDNATIPNDQDNQDWIAYQFWVSLGNTADPA